jgi:hypothetical protein
MNLLTGFHKHHIIPKYKGGSNAPDNLVLLHPIDHAIAHFVRFKIYGNPADGWAYNRLITGLKNKQISVKKGIPRPYMRLPKSAETKAKISAARKGYKPSPESIEKMRQSLIGRKSTGKSLESLHAYRHLAWSKEAQEKKSAKTKGIPRPYAKNSKPPSIESCRAGGLAGKGRKQTPEQIAKRVASRRATLAAQGRTH